MKKPMEARVQAVKELVAARKKALAEKEASDEVTETEKKKRSQLNEAAFEAKKKHLHAVLDIALDSVPKGAAEEDDKAELARLLDFALAYADLGIETPSKKRKKNVASSNAAGKKPNGPPH